MQVEVINIKNNLQSDMLPQNLIDFVHFAAHELKSPISTILLATNLISKELEGQIQENTKEYLKIILEDVNKIDYLIKLFLDISSVKSRTIKMSPQSLQISDVINKNIDNSMLQIKYKNLNLFKDIPNNLPILEADPKVIEIALDNIISNSVKYTNIGGSISIKVKDNKKNVVIRVSDTGLGIPENQKHFIFQKNFRADNAQNSGHEGMGMGLYLTKFVLNKIGGEVWLDTRNKHRTTFCVAIPKKFNSF